MSRLVVVAPLRPGGDARARELLDEGPPFDLADSPFDWHEVFVTPQEVVFVFGGTASAGETLSLAAEDPGIWRAAKDWADRNNAMDARGLPPKTISWCPRVA